MTRRVLLLLSAIIFYLLMEETLARGVLTIRLTDFRNRWGRTFDGACCDPSPTDTGGTCENQCDYVMRLIVSGLGRANDHVFLFHRPLKYDSNNIVFEHGESNLVLTVLFDQWPVDGRVKMNAFFYDYDDYDHTTTLVDWFETDLQYDVTSMQRALSEAVEVFHAQNVIGNRQSDKTRLTFEWSVLCHEGDNCIGRRSSTPFDVRTSSSVPQHNLKHQFNNRIGSPQQPASSVNNDYAYAYEEQSEEESYSPFRHQKQMFYPVGDGGPVYKPIQTNFYDSDLYYRRQGPLDYDTALSRKKKRRKNLRKAELENRQLYETEMNNVEDNEDEQATSAPPSQGPDFSATTNVLDVQNGLEAIETKEFYDEERPKHNINFPFHNVDSTRSHEDRVQDDSKPKEELGKIIDANDINLLPQPFKVEMNSPSTFIPRIPTFVTENHDFSINDEKPFLEREEPSRNMEINATPETLSPSIFLEQGQNIFTPTSIKSQNTQIPDLWKEFANVLTQSPEVHQLFDYTSQTTFSETTTPTAKHWPFTITESKVSSAPHSTEELPNISDSVEEKWHQLFVTDNPLSKEVTNFKNRETGSKFQFGSTLPPTISSTKVRLTEHNNHFATKGALIDVNIIPRDFVSSRRNQGNIKDTTTVRAYDNDRGAFLKSDYPVLDNANADNMYSTTTAIPNLDMGDTPPHRARNNEYMTTQRQRYFSEIPSPAIIEKDLKKSAFEGWDHGQLEESNTMFDKGRGGNRVNIDTSRGQYEEDAKPTQNMYTRNSPAENGSLLFDDRWWSSIDTAQQKAVMFDWGDVFRSTHDKAINFDDAVKMLVHESAIPRKKQDYRLAKNKLSERQHKVKDKLNVHGEYFDSSSESLNNRNLDAPRTKSRVSTDDTGFKHDEGMRTNDEDGLNLLIGSSNNIFIQKESRITNNTTTVPNSDENTLRQTDVDYNSYYLDPFGVNMNQIALGVGDSRYYTTQLRSYEDKLDNVLEERRKFEKTQFYDVGERKPRDSKDKKQENQDWDPFGINAKRFAIDVEQSRFYSTKQTLQNKFDTTTEKYMEFDNNYFYDLETIKRQDPMEQYLDNIQPPVSSSTKRSPVDTTPHQSNWVSDIWQMPFKVENLPSMEERKTSENSFTKLPAISAEFSRPSTVRESAVAPQFWNTGRYENDKSEDYNTADINKENSVQFKDYENYAVQQSMNEHVDYPPPQNPQGSGSYLIKKEPSGMELNDNAGIFGEHHSFSLQGIESKNYEAGDLLLSQKESNVGAGDLLLSQKENDVGAGDLLLSQKESDVGAGDLLLSQKESDVGAGDLLLIQKESDVGAGDLLLSQKESDVGAGDLLLSQKESDVEGNEKHHDSPFFDWTSFFKDKEIIEKKEDKFDSRETRTVSETSEKHSTGFPNVGAGTYWEETIPTRALKKINDVTARPLLLYTNDPSTQAYHANNNFDEDRPNRARKIDLDLDYDNSHETMERHDKQWDNPLKYDNDYGRKEERTRNEVVETNTRKELLRSDIQRKVEFSEPATKEGIVERTGRDSTRKDASGEQVFESFRKDNLGQKTVEELTKKENSRGETGENDRFKMDERLLEDERKHEANQKQETYAKVAFNQPVNSIAAASNDVFKGNTNPMFVTLSPTNDFMNPTPRSLRNEPFWFTTTKTSTEKDSRSLKRYFEIDYPQSTRHKDEHDVSGRRALYSTSVANIKESVDNVQTSKEPLTKIEPRKEHDQIKGDEGTNKMYPNNSNYKLLLSHRNLENPDPHILTDDLLLNEEREHLNVQAFSDPVTTTTTESLLEATAQLMEGEGVTNSFVIFADQNTPEISTPPNAAASVVNSEAKKDSLKTTYETFSKPQYATSPKFRLRVTSVSDEQSLNAMNQDFTPVTSSPALKSPQKEEEASPSIQTSVNPISTDRNYPRSITSTNKMLTPNNSVVFGTTLRDNKFPFMRTSQALNYKSYSTLSPRNKLLPRPSDIKQKNFAPAHDSPLWDITVEGYGSDFYLTTVTANVLDLHLDLEPQSMKTLPEKGFVLHTSPMKQIPRGFSLPPVKVLKTREFSPSKYVPKKEMDIDKYKQFLDTIRAGPTVNVPAGGLYTPEKDQNGTNSNTSFELPVSGRRRAERLQAEVDVGKMITRYWPAVLGITVGTIFLVTALVTSILCRQRRLLVQRARWDHSPQHVSEPPDVNEYSSSAASLTSDLTRSSINLV